MGLGVTDSDLTAPGPVDPGASEPRATAKWFRGDLDGLRAVAIVIAVLFHCGVPWVSGGFIGVDLFFVISGYLITRKLLGEVDRTDGVGLIEFWGRRLRRLVPALVAMLVVVLGLSLAVQSALEWESTAAQTRAAALYVSNIYFARQPSGYFGADLSHDLLLHTWSLGVEEQFYLLWPLMFVGVALVTRKRRDQRHLVLAVVLGAILVVSAITSQLLASSGSSSAYFSLPSRAWEFAIAGLLAMVTIPTWLRRVSLQVPIVLAGLAAIAVAAAVYTSADPYPGVRAILPVGGSILIIIGGEALAGGRTNPVSAMLAFGPLQWLGRLSYSWYLWHWPIILLVVEVLDRDSIGLRLAAAGLSLVIAIVMFYAVETPLRFNRRLTRSRVVTYTAAAAVTLAVVVASLGVTKYAHRTLADDPLLVAARNATQDMAKDVPCATTGRSQSGLEYCIDGDLTSDRTVVLFGDSHAGQWRIGFSEAAQASGIRLVTMWRPACPSIPVTVISPYNTIEECEAFERQGLELIAELDPELVVLSNSTNYSDGMAVAIGTKDPAAIGAAWSTGYEALLDDLAALGTPVASIIDNPVSNAKVPADCIVAERSGEPCAVPRDAALVGPSLRAAEARVQADRGIPTFSVVDDLCDAERCQVVVGDEVVFGDRVHLSTSFTLLYVPQIGQFLAAAMR